MNASYNDEDDIKNTNLSSARGIFLQSDGHRRTFYGYAKDANGGSLQRREFAGKIRDLMKTLNVNMSKAEANYCAGWGALAVQIIGDSHKWDKELYKLLEDAKPLGKNPEIVGG